MKRRYIYIIIFLLILAVWIINVVLKSNTEKLTVKHFEVKDYQGIIQEFPSNEVIKNISDKMIFLDEVEKIWIGIFGESVKEEKPYKVFYDERNEVWLVCGTIPENTLGGTAHILVDNSSGKVLAVWHEK